MVCASTVCICDLQHPPHALDVVLGVAPVSLRVQVAQEQTGLLAQVDLRHGPADLAGHEGGASAGRLVAVIVVVVLVAVL